MKPGAEFVPTDYVWAIARRAKSIIRNPDGKHSGIDQQPSFAELPKCSGLESIPTVSEWGLIVLTLLALVVGTFLVVRRRSVKEAVL